MTTGAIKTAFILLALAVLLFVLQSCDNKQPLQAQLARRSYELTYDVKAESIPTDANQVKVWLPVPAGRNAQKMHYYRVDTKIPYTVLQESKYGNNYLVFELDRQCISGFCKDGLQVVFGVTRYQDRPLESSWRQDLAETENDLKMYLTPNNLVPIDGEIAREANRVAGNMKGQFAKSKVLYEHIVKTVTYDKSGEGWGRGDAVYACDVRKGNCTDFHSLFIGELRSLGIPARFTIGFGIPEDENKGQVNYHCWAQFYIDGKGWLPVDASQASKQPAGLADYFAVVDENRVAFTIGRDIKLPGSSGEPVNFSIYPAIEVDGKSFDDIETTVTFEVIESPVNTVANSNNNE